MSGPRPISGCSSPSPSAWGSTPGPSEPALREIGETWRPWRSVAACLFWQSYLHARNRAAPTLAPELYATE